MTKRLRAVNRDEADQIIDNLRRLVRALRLAASHIKRRSGVSAAQLFVLHAIDERPAASLRELARRVRSDQSSVSVVVKRLVRAGLAKQVRSSHDRRVSSVTIANRGRTLVRRAPEPFQARLFDVLERFSNVERSTFAVLLSRLVRGMHAEDEKPRLLFEDEPEVRRKRRLLRKRRNH